MWRLLLGTMGVKSLVQGLNAAATGGFEPRTVWSEVRRRNRLATAPLWQKQNFAANDAYSAYCFEESNVFGNGKCELSAIQEWGKRCNFLARKSAKLFANTKVLIFGKEKCKTHHQFKRYLDDVTSVSLSLYLSLSPRAHLTHNIGSASALPIFKIICEGAWCPSPHSAHNLHSHGVCPARAMGRDVPGCCGDMSPHEGKYPNIKICVLLSNSEIW